MALIIAIINGKGGVGKSTVSINLAGALDKKGKSVFLVDSDPQGTVSDWYGSRKKQPVEKLLHKNLFITDAPWNAEKLTAKLKQLSRNYDYVIIDCGPANDSIEKTVLTLSNYAIIPVTPSPYDIRSVKKTIDLIKEGEKLGAIKVKSYLLISRKIVGTVLGREAREALTSFGIPVMKTEISQRIALCESGIEGKTIFEYAPDNPAVEEFKNLRKEVEKWQKQV
ncbi:MAG: AAA family ATPase [Elusimicrobia bacterium]|nr:AAA family ATPase [Elusimicrobiota bacterium]